MSIASSQAQKFYDQILADGRVFTFVGDDKSMLVYRIGDKDVVPFWSSRSRLGRVVAAHPKYGRFAPSEQSLDTFLTATLPLLRIEEAREWASTGPARG